MKTKNSLEVVKLSDSELVSYEKIILAKIASVEAVIMDLKGSIANPNGIDDTQTSLIPDENDALGSSKELNATLIIREGVHLKSLNDALVRIKNKTFGFCHITGVRIPDERLKLVPHTTTSIEGKEIENQRKYNARPYQRN